MNAKTEISAVASKGLELKTASVTAAVATAAFDDTFEVIFG